MWSRAAGGGDRRAREGGADRIRPASAARPSVRYTLPLRPTPRHERHKTSHPIPLRPTGATLPEARLTTRTFGETALSGQGYQPK